MATAVTVRVRDLAKTFTLHTQGGVRIAVFAGLGLEVRAGECVVVHGDSGSGKSTLLRSLYANYKPDAGSILVRHRASWIDMASAEPRRIIEVRRLTMGYVSQFLRTIPRVPALDIVAEPLIRQGIAVAEAAERARTLLARLRIPERLWQLAPATFSGGERQRVNIARSFLPNYPVLLLDEPTAALDALNQATVVDLIREAKVRGAAIVGIFHDRAVRDAVADRLFAVEDFKRAA